MAIELDHTIIYCSDPRKSSRIWARILGSAEPYNIWGMFDIVALANGVSLFFGRGTGPIQPQHYAFKVSEPEFDEIFARVKAEGLKYFSDPFRNRPGHINHDDGGRGVYFDVPDNHYVEVITRPYGVLR